MKCDCYYDEDGVRIYCDECVFEDEEAHALNESMIQRIEKVIE